MEKISTRTTGNIRIIQYDNPPRRYLTAKGSYLLWKAVEEAVDDESVRAVILTGTDDVFIRHYDVSEIIKTGEALASGAVKESDFDKAPFSTLTNLIESAPKPVIAAINGICMGGGFELALACDIRVASASTQQIGLPETRLNILPGGGGTQRLPRLIGEAAALNLILRGTVMDARQAAIMGLVHEVAKDALIRAEEIAAELSERNAASLAAAKGLVRGATSRSLKDGLQEEQNAFVKILDDDDAKAAMRTFCDSDEQDITG